MPTRCPNVACHEVFADSAHDCTKCGGKFTPRPLEVWQAIDKQAQKQRAVGRYADAALIRQVAANSPIVGILEDIRSLWNVGSIFRSADGAGCKGLLLCGITGTPPRKEIAKTSLGAEETVQWAYSSSATEVIPALKELGFFMLGLEFVPPAHQLLPASTDLSQMLRERRPPAPICIIVGNEVTGLLSETMLQCDAICHLPMRGMKESLNVAVAFGIGAYAVAEDLAKRPN